jgi:hypothetical protein
VAFFVWLADNSFMGRVLLAGRVTVVAGAPPSHSRKSHDFRLIGVLNSTVSRRAYSLLPLS